MPMGYVDSCGNRPLNGAVPEPGRSCGEGPHVFSWEPRSMCLQNSDCAKHALPGPTMLLRHLAVAAAGTGRGFSLSTSTCVRPVGESAGAGSVKLLIAQMGLTNRATRLRAS